MGEKSLKPKYFYAKKQLPKDTVVIDAFERSLHELFFIENPRYKKEMPESQVLLKNYLKNSKIKGIYIYYPWRNTAIYTLPEDLYFKLRSARNRDVITVKEQEIFRNSRIGIVGLSVGSVLLASLVANGGPKYIRVADFDEIEITNLNRMKATLLDIGKNKAVVASRSAWELDPFAEIEIWEKGVNKDNLQKFIVGKQNLDVFIDTMDSLDLKILSRFICQKNRIPVVMITENADNSILDVERYDLDRELPIFNGRLGKPNLKDFKNLEYRQWLKLASQIVGPDFLAPRMQQSILKLGKSVASVPQLSTSVAIGGASATAVIRRIVNKLPLRSGRYLIELDKEIVPGYMSKNEVKSRNLMTNNFIKMMRG